GCILPAQMPAEFLDECIYPEKFLSEANQNLYMARTLMGFKNRMAESRRVVAGQMKEVSEMVKHFAESMPEIKDFSLEIEEKIVGELDKKKVVAEDIFAYEKQDGRLEISLQAKTSKGRLVTSAEVARVLSHVLGRTICPSAESRKVLVNEMVNFVFVEDTPLYAITGVARIPKDGEEISGDTFSCITLPGGEMLLALSDGMGSGSDAMEESKTVIELLEQMAEAGFSHSSAIRLINSLYMSREEEAGYATADIVILNLYKGDCCFLKNGASATYLRHNKRVMMIEGQTLPVGVVHEIESYVGKVGISGGDYVIMMTDGVSDCFMEDEEDLSGYLKRCEIINPQEIAKHILDEAVRRSGGKASDDMTVIVAGIWERV
ncbi:MAG: SpoIIE family protein phosphatase, partial [Lachnospiraceae bacterium]|nr:SpoIIE family protein phosphatase [Lachnospiraceae bacterium]